MNEAQLKKFLEEMSVFLKALDKALPGRVDLDMIQFLESTMDNDWGLSMLLNTLAGVKVDTAPQQQMQNQPFKRTA